MSRASNLTLTDGMVEAGVTSIHHPRDLGRMESRDTGRDEKALSNQKKGRPLPKRQQPCLRGTDKWGFMGPSHRAQEVFWQRRLVGLSFWNSLKHLHSSVKQP